MGKATLARMRNRDAHTVLRRILEGHSARVTGYVPQTRQLHARAFWSNGHPSEDFWNDIEGVKPEDDLRLVVIKETESGLPVTDWSI